MLVLEIAAQGVRGVSPAGGRATLRPGYNVVAADGAALRRVVEALFYPDPRDGESIPRTAAGPGSVPVRAGITLAGNDGLTYRLVRDFQAGCQLHRFDPERRAFSLVSQDLAEVGRFLQATAGVPSRARLASLLSFAAAELPSRQPAAGLRGAGLSQPPPRRALSPEQARKKIAELEAELARAQVSDKLQYQLDGLQSRLFKVEELLKGEAKIREGLEAAEAAQAELAKVAEAAERLGDADGRLAAFEKASAKRDEGLARVEEERAAFDEEDARGRRRPFWTDPGFLGAAGAGVGAVGIAVVASGAALGMRYIALLDIPAFGYAGWVALRWIGELETREKGSRRRRLVEEWEKKVVDQYERDTADVRAAVQATGAAHVRELKDQLGRLADANAVAAEWRRRLEEWEAKPETRSARSDKQKVEEELRGVEARLGEQAGGYVRDARSIEAEIARLRAELQAPPPPAAPPPVAEPSAAGGDPLKMLLERAAAELGGTPAGALRTVQARAGQALAALAVQRLGGCNSDDRGNLQVQSGGKLVAAATLPATDRDLCFIALKLAFMELAFSQGRLAAIVDDGLSGLPEAIRRVAAQLLKQAARGGQIVHATADPLFRAAADHAA